MPAWDKFYSIGYKKCKYQVLGLLFAVCKDVLESWSKACIPLVDFTLFEKGRQKKYCSEMVDMWHNKKISK